MSDEIIPRLITRAGGVTLRGANRPENQDRWAVLARGRLVILADGEASRPCGWAASDAAVDAVESYFVRLSMDGPQLAALASKEAIHHLLAGFTRAQAAVVTAARFNAHPIATSLLASIVVERHAVIAHVGHSRAYLHRAGELTQVTSDHRFWPEGMSELTMDEVEAITPLIGLPDRLLGVVPAARVEISVVALQPGDRLLLCTNGLSDALGREQIEAALAAGKDEYEANEGLRKALEARRSQDDATSIVIDVRADATPPDPKPALVRPLH